MTTQTTDTAQALRNAFGHFATGVTIITAMDAQGAAVGVTANSFSSLSLDPPLVLWSLAKTSSNYSVFEKATHFAIHVLDASQTSVAQHFAKRGTDRFASIGHTPGTGGVPLLADFHACFECETHSMTDGGDHTILIGRVMRTTERPGEPLLFYRGQFARAATLTAK